MTRHRTDLTRGVPLPSTWVNSLMEFVSSLSSPTFKLSLASSTSVQVLAGAGNDQVSMPLAGKWRWAAANVSPAAHPGGAAGVYDVWAAGFANDFTSIDPADATTYGFSLTIRARVSGSPDPPTATGATALSRRVGEVTWSGTAITGLYNILVPGDVPMVTALHPAPWDGLTIDYLADPTLDVVFRLRYRSASSSSYKWVCISGGPMIGASGSMPVSTTLTDLGCTITIPLAGDWLFNFSTYGDFSGDGQQFINIRQGTEALASATAFPSGFVVNGNSVTVAGDVRRNVAAAGTTVSLWSGGSGRPLMSWRRNHLSALPLRVG